MSRDLVLIGGGHAHMVTLARLAEFVDRGHRVVVIQPSAYHYYSGMGPGMLGGTYRPEDIRFATRERVERAGGTFLMNKAFRIDPHRQVVLLESGDEVRYDVLSCNAGSQVPIQRVEGDSGTVYGSKPIEVLLEARQAILQQCHKRQLLLAVVGGGPSALEIAGNLHQLCRSEGCQMANIQVLAGRNFMAGRPERVRRLARQILAAKGIEIKENGYAKRIIDGRLELDSGEVIEADFVFSAVGVKPSPIFQRSGLPIGPDGGLRVNAFLQSIRYPNIFGGGDCIYFEPQPLDKVGVYAVRQNPILFANLLAALEDRPLQKFEPGPSYLLIYNLGDGVGILSKWSLTFSGRLAFRFKDWIDRRFMSSFQSGLSGEGQGTGA